MLISKNWIQDFVELPNVSDQELASRFTLTTAEVEGFERTWEHLKEIKIAQIKEIRKHPEADKLNLVTVDLGGGRISELVCGAPNVKLGLKVAYAKVGTTLPGGFTLEPKKIRGVLSEGMLCSEKELGLGEGTSGLMEFDNYSANVGDSLESILSISSDTVLDVDNKSLTHRPDLWGHHGLAREFAAAFKTPFKDPYDISWYAKMEGKLNSIPSPILPSVDKNSSCLTYLGLSMDGVQVKPSPPWMVQRLEAAGLRSVNNMVDIGNYVMLELGIPLHIFDRDLIKGQLSVKPLEKDEVFLTLDGGKRALKKGDTVVADEEKTLVIAGIMGGESSGVGPNTENIFIEVANWEPSEVRKLSSRLGLRTDSSQRYEKALDGNLCRRTLLRAMELVLKLCPEASVIGGVQSFTKEEGFPLMLQTSIEKISQVLGTEVKKEEVLRIFSSLGFQVTELTNGSLDILLPSYRTTKDIEYEADLIEEVGRMIGYDSISPKAPLMEVAPVSLSPQKLYHRKIQDFLVLKGRSFGVMTYPLTGRKTLDKVSWPHKSEGLVLQNALSIHQDRMRSSLVPGILEAVGENHKNFEAFSLFELGRVYLEDKKSFSLEENHLAFAMVGKDKTRFLELINRVEELLTYLGVNFKFEESGKGKKNFENSFIPKNWPGTHPFEFLNVKIMGAYQGGITSIHPSLLKDLKINAHVSLAIINISSFEKIPLRDRVKYKAINKLPKASFDCSVLVKRGGPAQEAIDALSSLKIKELKAVKIVSVYPLDSSHNSVTLRSFFEDPKKTMGPEFLKDAEDRIVRTLEEKGFPLKC